jgi:hypothetical protein
MLPPQLLRVLRELFGPNVEVGAAAIAVVLTGIAARAYFGSVLFHPRYVVIWNVVRRVAAPILQRVVYRYLPFDIQIENESEPDEYAGTVEMAPKELSLALDSVREVEVPLLNGYKTGPDGRKERATLVWYYGSKPLSSLPRWLRRKQVDITVYERDDGRYDVFSHAEANSYRPDLWADHLLKGASFDAAEGVRRTQSAFDDAELEWSIENDAAPTERGA